MFFNRMDGADIGMIQGRRGASFALETLHGGGIPGQFFRQELQSDAASEFDVFGLVNYTHTAAAQDLQDSIMRDLLTDQDLFVGGRGNRALGFYLVRVLTRMFRPLYWDDQTISAPRHCLGIPR